MPRPTGHPRRTAGDYRAAAAAAAYGGLPPEITHPKQLLEPCRAAGAALPITHTELTLLSTLVDSSHLDDWRKPDAPILVWLSNAEIAGRLGITCRSATRCLSHLRRAAAIAVIYGPGSRRNPLRDSTGRPVPSASYGIDLRPLKAFADEMRIAAAAAAARRTAARTVLLRISAALGDCTQHLDAARLAIETEAVEPGERTARLERLERLVGTVADALAAARACAGRDSRTADPDENAANARHLADLVELAGTAAASAAAEAASLLWPETPEAAVAIDLIGSESPSPDSRVTHNTTTDLATISCNACKDVAGPGTAVPDTGSADYSPIPDDRSNQPQPKVSARKLAEISPTFADALRRLRMCSPEAAQPHDISVCGRQIAASLGLSEPALRRGQHLHGELTTALAAFAAADLPAYRVRTSRAAVLAGMLRKPPGVLKPLATLYGLHRARNAGPEATGRAVPGYYG